MSDLTRMLENYDGGEDPKAAEELLKAVYEEFRKIAWAKMQHERPGHTLQPTILVNDAWLKLFQKGKSPKFESSTHFFGAASEAMRRILVDHARKRDAAKRGKKVDMSETAFDNLQHRAPDQVILDVDDALDKFAAHHGLEWVNFG
jgi:RNA polymerase sigma factor (TIGR02999 family)